jgi:hypothetical protein
MVAVPPTGVNVEVDLLRRLARPTGHEIEVENHLPALGSVGDRRLFLLRSLIILFHRGALY